jgi:hypothetical protein
MTEIEALYNTSADRRTRSFHDDAEAMFGLEYPAGPGAGHYVRSAWSSIGRMFGAQPAK